MSDTQNPDQQLPDPPAGVEPAIDAAGIGQETGEVPAELDDDPEAEDEVGG